jgi:myo-inositol-1(or 4)-monophosphatase
LQDFVRQLAAKPHQNTQSRHAQTAYLEAVRQHFCALAQSILPVPDMTRNASTGAADAAEYLDFAIELANLAAGPALALFRTGTAIDSKLQGGFDPVTRADREAEEAMRAAIEARYPEHGILGEEHGEKPAKSGWRWVLDPIDGTRSFICGTPTWMTLVALEFEGHPVVGVAAQPYTGEIFAGDGRHAFLERGGIRTPLATTPEHDLASVLAGTTAPHLFRAHGHQGRLDRLMAGVRHLRWDADAYFHCMVAAGQLGVSLDTGLQAYDIAALIPVIEGAGGIVTTWTGESAAKGGDIVASGNRALHDKALALLA